MPVSWDLLMGGSVYDAIKEVLLSTWGNYFYVIFFGTVYIMLYLKTEELGVPTIAICWSMVLYGAFFPGMVAPGIMTIAFFVGLAAMAHKVISPAK